MSRGRGRYTRYGRMTELSVCGGYGSLTDVGCFFFFQAEDGIRDTSVTGVQTCALPIFPLVRRARRQGGQPARGDQSVRRDGPPRRPDEPARQARRRGDEVQPGLRPQQARRSEERRVGKEGRARGGAARERKNRSA